MDLETFITNARAFLSASAPGGEKIDMVKAAVLAPVTQIDGIASVGLIHRPRNLNNHPDQIALPGGHIEPGETPIVTALRETEEEIGVRPEIVEVLGFMPTVMTVRTGFMVWPLVGILREKPDIRLSPDEADEFFWAPVSHFMKPENVVRRETILEGDCAPLPAFRYNGYEIWGLTFRIIKSLVEGLNGHKTPVERAE